MARQQILKLTAAYALQAIISFTIAVYLMEIIAKLP